MDALEAPGVNFPLIEVADAGPGQADPPDDDMVVQEADDAVRPILRAQRIAKLEGMDRIVMAFMDTDSDSDERHDEIDDQMMITSDSSIGIIYATCSLEILIVIRFESKA